MESGFDLGRMTPPTQLRSAIRYALETLPKLAGEDARASTPCRQWNLEDLCLHLHSSVSDLNTMLGAAATSQWSGHWKGLPTELRSQLLVLREMAALPAPATPEMNLLDATTLLRVAALEVAVHTWDIRSACGLRGPLPPDLASGLWSSLELALPPPEERHGLFADPVDVRATDDSDRLLSALGRNPYLWSSNRAG